MILNTFRSIPNWKQNAARGQGLVEYALILVLVSVVSIVILAMVGGTVSNVFGNVVCSLENSEDCSVDSGSSGTSTSGTSTSGTSTSGTSTSGTSTSGTSTSGTSTSGTSTSGTSTSGTSTSGTSTSGTSTSGTSTSGTSTSGTSTSGTSTGSLPGGGSPPSIDSISDATMDAGDSLDVAISANDDDGDVIVLSLPGAPSFAALNATGGNGTITFTPGSSDAGSYTITVQAAANGDVVTTDFSLTVNASSPPSFNPISAQTVTTGNTLNVNVTATDAEGDPITLSLLSPPAFASISSTGGNGTITLTPTTGQDGSYTITVQAVANGDTVTTNFNLTVNPDPCDTASAPSGSVFHLINPTIPSTLSNDSSINASSFNQKTMAVRFSTGSDVNTRQVIYEQGGTVKGLVIYIDAGQLYAGMWSTNPNWGTRHFNTSVSANASYHLVMVFDNPSIQVFVNGSSIGSVNDAGVLNSHTGGIGVGRINGDTYWHDGAEPANSGFNFSGSLFEAVQWNSALSGSSLNDLHTYFNCGNTP